MSDRGRPVLRVDIYDRESSAFEAAIVWQGNLIIGRGSNVHAVSTVTRETTTTSLESYFNGLYPASEYLLVASGSRLYRMEPDRSVLWVSPVLGLDGVAVDEIAPSLIRGRGEWEPPGGWRPFCLNADDGQEVKP